MTTFTELVASVVVHSSAVALSHFGVTIEPAKVERASPPVEHIVARTPAQQLRRAVRLTACPQPIQPPRAVKI